MIYVISWLDLELWLVIRKVNFDDSSHMRSRLKCIKTLVRWKIVLVLTIMSRVHKDLNE